MNYDVTFNSETGMFDSARTDETALKPVTPIILTVNLPTTRFELSENQRSMLVNALHSAIAKYEENAKTLRKKCKGHERLAELFDTQVSDTQALASRLENAHTIIVGAEVE